MKRRLYFLVGILVMVTLSSCKGSRQNIEEELSDITNPHPTENLTYFYDMEGVRDERFSEDDKGVWSVSTSITYVDEEEQFNRDGMRLLINRNTRVAEGYYFQYEYSGTKRVSEKQISVQMVNGRIAVMEEVDTELQEEIENFKFGVQYLTFQPEYLNNLKKIDTTYTSNVSLYSITYELENDDENIQNILTQYSEYPIQIEEKPTLYLDGSGEKGNENVGRRSLEIYLNRTKDIMYRSLAIYGPDEER